MHRKLIVATLFALAAAQPHSVLSPQSSVLNPQSPVLNPQSVLRQTQAEADAKSVGCLTCHKGIEPMHQSAAVRLGCIDCHGGDAIATTKQQAHVQPRHPEIWKTSANPPRTYTQWLDESPE